MSMYEVHIVDLNGLQNYEFIQFLRVEILNVRGYAPTFFGRVRYSLDGVEQDEGLPMDLSKGIFIATLRDDQLGNVSREKLEQTLQEASVKIIETVRKDPNMKKLLLDYSMYNENCSVEKLPDTSGIVLKSILKDFPHLKYDENLSKPPDRLRCRVVNPKKPRQADDIFEIARRLSDATDENYSVVTYGGNSDGDDNFDKTWTWFAIRKFNFQKVSSDKT